MAITRYVGNIFIGLSSDTKPSTVPDGARFYESDTLQIYMKVSAAWVLLTNGTGTPNTISSTPTTLTVAQCLGFIHYVTVAGVTTINLPAVSTVIDGSYVTIYMTTAYQLIIDPNASDRIKLDGVDLSDGYKIASDSRVGNFVSLHKDSSNGWTVMGKFGYWINGGA
jgi:hypothetical protein